MLAIANLRALSLGTPYFEYQPSVCSDEGASDRRTCMGSCAGSTRGTVPVALEQSSDDCKVAFRIVLNFAFIYIRLILCAFIIGYNLSL